MATNLDPADRAKFASAEGALSFIEDGMRLGLGTGSTAAWLVRLLAEKVQSEKLDITCVPTSSRTKDLAQSLGLKVTTLDSVGWLDLTIDGADEFDPELNLIKGGGGALLQEKIVATASDQMLVISDDSKQVASLGAFPLPVEVVRFGWETTKAIIEPMALSVLLNQIPGVVETGLFVDVADAVCIGYASGEHRIMRPVSEDGAA